MLSNSLNLPSELTDKVFTALAESDSIDPNEVICIFADTESREIHLTVNDERQVKNRYFKLKLTELELDENDNLIEKEGEDLL